MFGLKAKRREEINQEIIREIVAEDQERTQFTPDAHILNRHQAKLLFVHDDMAQLQPMHDLVQEGSLSGFYPFDYGYTTKKFSFVKKDLGLKSFPIALDLDRETRDNLPVFISEEYRIRGELYAIRPCQFYKLDTHRQNGIQFERRRVNINVGYRKLYRTHWFNAKGIQKYEYNLGKEEMTTVEAFMYVGRNEYWKDQLLSDGFNFQPIPVIQEDRLWLKEYYQYSRVR